MYQVNYTCAMARWQYATYADACEAIRAMYPTAAIGHSGDLSDGGDRTLVWADEADAVNDDGRRAVATISRQADR